MTLITSDVAAAVAVLKEGRVVAFPTGTSYGLAVDALQGHALQRLRNLKGRPAAKTFTVFLDPELWDTHLDLTQPEQQLLAKFASQPLTLLVTPRQSLQHLAQDELVGLRIIDHPVMAALAQAAAVPLTATSANHAAEQPAYTAAAVAAAFPGKIDPPPAAWARAGATTYDLSLGCILDGGSLPQHEATTIARITNGTIEIIRAGTLTAATLQAALD